MPLKSFVQFSADRHEEIEELALSRLPAIQGRALELYNDPDARSDELTKRYLFAGYSAMVAEIGNEELAAAYWDNVAELVDLPVDVLAEASQGGRGDVWTAAMGIILAVSMEQARGESGLTVEAAAKGVEMGEELKTVAKGLGRKGLEGATFHIRTELKERKEKKKQDGNNGGA